MKKTLALVCACLIFLCTGCAGTPERRTQSATTAAASPADSLTLFDTSTLQIVLDGAETTVTDKISGSEYSFTTTRKISTEQPTLEQRQARCIARTTTNTDTMKIELAGGLIIVTDKSTGQIYYIQH